MPDGDRWSIEPKFDGWRGLVFRDEEQGVRLQSRSGRLITPHFPDLVDAALRLPPGTVLDGEIVVWHEGRADFAAVQRRALTATQRATALAARHPASFAAFDVLEAEETDLRGRPYEERRARLLEVLDGLGPPLQPVPATRDRMTALDWWERWTPELGIEGLMVKHVRGTYNGRTRDWRKLKHWDAR